MRVMDTRKEEVEEEEEGQEEEEEKEEVGRWRWLQSSVSVVIF